MRRALALVVLGTSLAAGGRARAQGDSAALAQALFEDGRRLMLAGDTRGACPKLAESQRLDPGIGTLLNLGDCWELDRKTASAWAAFVDAEALANRAGQTARARYAADKAAALAPRLSHLVIRVPDAARVPGLAVLRDRELLGDAVWGAPMPIDLGVHVIEAEAPGHEPYRREVDVGAEAVTLEIEVPALEPLPPPPILVLPPPPSVPFEGAPPPLPPASAARRGWGIGVGAAGAAGIGAGFVLGAVAMGENAHTRELGCTSTTCPTREGVAVAHEARMIANAATAATVVGALALAAGIALVVWSAPSLPARPSLRVGARSVRLEGAF